MANKTTVQGQADVIGTFAYAGHTLVAAHGAPYKYGNKVTNIALLLAHFGYITNAALVAAYGGNSVANMAGWFKGRANGSTPAQRYAPYNNVGLADKATCAAVGLGETTALVVAQPTPIPWLPGVAASGALPLLSAGYAIMVAAQKAATGKLTVNSNGAVTVVKAVKPTPSAKPSKPPVPGSMAAAIATMQAQAEVQGQAETQAQADAAL